MLVATILIVGILGILLTAAVGGRFGAPTFLFVIVISSLALVPRRLVTIGALDGGHVGITTSTIMISTYTAALMIAGVYCLSVRTLRIPIPFVVFLVAAAALLVPAWGGSVAQTSGLWHLGVAILAWGVGYGLSTTLDRDDRTSTRWAATLTWILIIQSVVVVLTMAGVDLPSMITLTDREVTNRVVGTLGNPANLSKVTFFLLVILLPLTSSKLRETRRWAGVGVALSLILTGLTISRANMVAVAALVAVWALLMPGRMSMRTRLSLVIVGGIAAFFFVGPFLERLQADPQGTLRPALEAAAIAQIQESPWLGVGLNSYVGHVGQVDATTAAGFPVHNTFLLMIAEVGLPLSVLFFLPFVALVLAALRKRHERGGVGAFAWATLGAIPGVLAIGLTGWGLLSSFVLPLWMFVFGVVAAQIGKGGDVVGQTPMATRAQLRAGTR